MRLGLESLDPLEPTHVLIHDGARPLLSAALIARVLAALETDEAALPVLPVVDTLKRAEGEHLVAGPDRQELARAQTPQGFRFAPILAAHRAAAGRELTDDAAVAEAAGITVRRVEGEKRNLKVTTRDDLTLAGLLLAGAPRAYRTGMGYDVHAFAEGRPWSCAGSASRTSVACSATRTRTRRCTRSRTRCSARSGPATSASTSRPRERWRDCDSGVFLRHARGLVEAKGGRIVNVDLVIVCERPKIGPHREAMRARLADLLGVAARAGRHQGDDERGMGFTGRGEGLVAQAVATVSFPAEAGDGAVPYSHLDLARRLLAACEAAGLRLATAESCTGGLIAGCLTEIAGSSTVVDRGYVVYDNRAKEEMLGVQAETLRQHGAVSEATARAMAEGALVRSGCGLGVAVTGIAGPGGGTAEKPVGLVHMAAVRQGLPTLHRAEVFGGDRGEVRLATVEEALLLALAALQPQD